MTNPNIASTKIQEGYWDDNISWEFHLSSEVPDSSSCSAVYCLAISNTDPDSIVLTRNTRGWEMLGGHLEPGETLEETLAREALEEGGFYISNYQLFGFRKVIAKQPVANDHHGGTYPLVSYIPHFFATSDRSIVAPTGEEIFESRTFTLDSLPELKASDLAIIMAGLACFHA